MFEASFLSLALRIIFSNFSAALPVRQAGLIFFPPFLHQGKKGGKVYFKEDSHFVILSLNHAFQTSKVRKLREGIHLKTSNHENQHHRFIVFLHQMSRMKKAVLIILFFFTFLIVGLHSKAQCSICTKTAQQLGEKPAKGMNSGILYLAFAPFAIVGYIGYRWWKSNKDA